MRSEDDIPARSISGILPSSLYRVAEGILLALMQRRWIFFRLLFYFKILFICTSKSHTLINKDMSDISSRVKSIIIDKLGVEESEVTSEASFTNDLGADSLDTVELIMEFEKEFNIAIPDDQAEKIGTVGQAIKYIEENSK